MIKNDWKEQERREYERHSVKFYLAVYEANAEAPLGQIVDISLGGMRLLSEQPAPIEGPLNLIIDISLESGRKGQCRVSAERVWAKEDDNPGLYLSGFQFTDLSLEAKAFVQSIIDELR